MSTTPVEVDTKKLLAEIKSKAIPQLTDDRHKGQYGRIGVIGGSLEYTGAPYFAAISALKVGADLAHVFCQLSAATVIKSYSPELIVHPVLDADDAFDQIAPLLERLHVLVIGPGLGRNPKVQDTTIRLIELCRRESKPMIIDADGLTILNDRFDLITQGPNNVILTPNAIEYRRLFGDDENAVHKRMSQLGEGVLVLEKGARDRLHVPAEKKVYIMPAGGSGRRCGGQGDLLCGSLATFYHWCLESKQPNPGLMSAFAASCLVKQCNRSAYKKHGRGMLASDMIEEIPNLFRRTFENTEDEII